VPVWATGLKSQWEKCFLPLATNISRLWRASGRDFLVSYLKEATKICVHWVSQTPYTVQPNGVRVKRARSGLPSILPGRLRYLIATSRRLGSTKGLLAFRVTLTILSIYRVIGCRPVLKLFSITDGFTGQTATLPNVEVRQAISCLGVSLKGLERAIPNLFSEAAGPNYPRATWSGGLDALAFWCSPLQWWHFSVIAVRSRSYTLLAWLLGIMLLSVPVLPLLAVGGWMPTKLGRLSKLYEAAGKVRVIAITDWWTQCLLLPLHRCVFTELRSIYTDCTFDQTGGLNRVREIARGRPAYSFDLTSATDRIPIALQEQILSALGLSWAASWRSLLSGRDWWLGTKPLRYAVGQPMGAYSSWAMLALTHHVIVQVSAYRVGWRHFFPYYAVLGDDVVIFDQKVAEAYRELMAALGVPINMSKSLVSEKGWLEFAKRWFGPDLGDVSPLGPGLILVTIRNLRYIPLVVSELSTKCFGFLPSQLKDLIALCAILRRKVRVDAQLISLLALGPTGGLWGSGQLAEKSAAWIAAFHQKCAPELLNLYVYYACCAYTIVQANRAMNARSEQEKNLIHNWIRFPLFGRGPAMALLSMPLMLLSPGLWVTLARLGENPVQSIAFADSVKPFFLDEQAARLESLRDLSKTYIGSVSALNWTDRAKVLDFYATQDFLLKEVSRTLRDGLYDAGALVPYEAGGALIRVQPVENTVL
jgi:hypothetical protein